MGRNMAPPPGCCRSCSGAPSPSWLGQMVMEVYAYVGAGQMGGANGQPGHAVLDGGASPRGNSENRFARICRARAKSKPTGEGQGTGDHYERDKDGEAQWKREEANPTYCAFWDDSRCWRWLNIFVAYAVFVADRGGTWAALALNDVQLK